MFQELNESDVLYKLLGYGMFPQSLDSIFTSFSYQELVIKNLKSPNLNIGKNEFLPVNFKQTRNNNAARYMQIPHPLGYSHLVFCISENWKEIKSLILKDNLNYENTSLIIPKNNDEERLIYLSRYDIEILQDEFRLVFNQANIKSEDIIIDKKFLRRYVAKSDISNFFNSIYSHSIPWAIVGKEKAKENISSSLWYNKLDKLIRQIKHNETNGISIGPDTSNIISEIILSRVDAKLQKKGYIFVRYIDDYNCFCKTKEESERFIQDLSTELELYKLTVNTKKTFIKELPEELQDSNFSTLNNFLIPEEVNEVTINKIICFLDIAVGISEKNGEYSPFKYAIKLLSNKINTSEINLYLKILKYIGNVTFIHPYLIDSLDKFIEYGLNNLNNSEEIRIYLKLFLSGMIKEHIKLNKSDIITWCFYFAIKYSIRLEGYSDFKKILLRDIDTIPLLMLILYSNINNYTLYEYDKKIKILDQKENWILIYEYNRLIKNKGLKTNLKIGDYTEFYNYLLKNKICFLNDIVINRLKGITFYDEFLSSQEIDIDDLPF